MFDSERNGRDSGRFRDRENIARNGIGRHVDVGGRTSGKRVADASAYQKHIPFRNAECLEDLANNSDDIRSDSIFVMVRKHAESIPRIRAVAPQM